MTPPPIDEEEAPFEEYEKEGRGRSENRRNAKSFDVLALSLLELTPQRCARFPVSEELLASLKTAHSTKAKAARRRELRRLSGMLRNRPEEAAAIEALLAGQAVTPFAGDENAPLEKLRELLCDSESFSKALETATESLPQLDVLLVHELCTPLHALDAAARCEKKAYRLLFKELRRASDENEALDDAE